MKNNNNFFNFIFYTFVVITFSTLFILKITIKNECISTQSNIEDLNNMLIKNTDIVKELQSTRDYLMSYEYVENYLSNKMVASIPETLIINIGK